MTKVKELGRIFDNTPAGNRRRYWYVGGFSAGIIGVGTIQHWGYELPDIGLILGGSLLLLLLLTLKQREMIDV